MTTSLEQKVIRTSPVLWFLGLLFALFLSGMGSQVLYDIADVIRMPQEDTFETVRVKPLEAQRDALNSAPNPYLTQVNRAERDLQDQERVLGTAESSWRTWLETRATLGRAEQEDREVRSRRNHLDALRRERDAAEKALADLKATPDPREAQLADLNARIDSARQEALQSYSAALAGWRWKVLTARLFVVLPVWLLAIVLWNRRQNSRYVTLVGGYLGFAAWMLLYGVVPYLPQYGGYVPLALGALTTVWIARSLVGHFNQQADQRRRRIVDRAVARHQCPGCERDYLIGSETGLDASLARKANVSHYDAEALHPRACPACGLPLFGQCPACQHVQMAHQDYCGNCGQKWPSDGPTPTPPTAREVAGSGAEAR